MEVTKKQSLLSYLSSNFFAHKGVPPMEKPSTADNLPRQHSAMAVVVEDAVG